jgi:hypothetical protein
VQRDREGRDRPAGGGPDAGLRLGEVARHGRERAGPDQHDARRGAVGGSRHAAGAEHHPGELTDLLLDGHLGHQVGDEPFARGWRAQRAAP